MIITECFIPVFAVKISWLMILHTRQNVLVCLFTCFVLIVFLFLFLLFGRMLLVVVMRRSGSGRKFAESSWRLHYASPWWLQAISKDIACHRPAYVGKCVQDTYLTLLRPLRTPKGSKPGVFSCGSGSALTFGHFRSKCIGKLVLQARYRPLDSFPPCHRTLRSHASSGI